MSLQDELAKSKAATEKARAQVREDIAAIHNSFDNIDRIIDNLPSHSFIAFWMFVVPVVSTVAIILIAGIFFSGDFR